MNRNKPLITIDTIKAMEDMRFFIHARIFDDLLIVAQRETNCFVLKTKEGLIVIDAIWPTKQAFEAIVKAIQDVGWNPNDLKMLVLTHGHADHTGCGRYLVDYYHVQTYLSKRDTIYWEEHPTKPDRPETWKDYSITHYIKDGDSISLGEKTIYVYETPGHTPGCLSYLFPVAENGNMHMAALWGGVTPPFDKKQTVQYLKSLDYFMREAQRNRVDVALSNHTAIDCGLERIRYSQSRLSYLPNVYIIGQEGFQNYCQVFRTLSYERLESDVDT